MGRRGYSEVGLALIAIGSSRCTLCGDILQEGQDLVATWAWMELRVEFPRQIDSAMHRACFLAWPRRDEFRAQLNAAMRRYQEPYGRYQVLEADGTYSWRAAREQSDHPPK